MNMKFDLMSDLHIDVNKKFFLPEPNEGSEILVLAGDLAEFGSLMNTYFKPFHEMAKMYKHVVYIAGNHEFYGANYQATVKHFRETFGRMYEGNVIHFLHGDTWEVPDSDVAFVGGTLFTDMNGGDPWTMRTVEQCMADFTYITYNADLEPAISWQYPQDKLANLSDVMVYGGNRICKPADYIREHKAMLLKFENECDRLADKKIVLVTHHAMSEKSVSPIYERDYLMNGGYRSWLEPFFDRHRNVKVHCHGHMHTYFRYEIAETRIYCNPCGYTKYGETRKDYGPIQIEV